MSTTDKLPFAGHKFLFVLDDSSDDTCWVKSVEGGNIKSWVLTENVAIDAVRFNHIGKYEIEPFSLEMGLGVSKGMMTWIQKSWKRDYVRYNGSLTHVDVNYRAVLEQSFENALISEVTFPALEGKGSDAAWVTVKLQPEIIELKKGGGQVADAPVASFNPKAFAISQFKLTIGGSQIDGVTKLESITVKQKLAHLYTGLHREGEFEPTGIEFPGVTVTIDASKADFFYKWQEQYIFKGGKPTEQEQEGAIEYLSNDGSKTIFTLELHGVGLNNLSFAKSDTGSSAAKTIKAELYVDSMSFTPGKVL